NAWIGVSLENQAAADERLPDLLEMPAALRFISAEPLLGPINLDAALWKQCPAGFDWPSGEPRGVEFEARKQLRWVIAGAESGPDRRACKVEWLRGLRDQCLAASVPFFLKQAVQHIHEGRQSEIISAGHLSKRKRGGLIELPYLDGVQHATLPEGVS